VYRYFHACRSQGVAGSVAALPWEKSGSPAVGNAKKRTTTDS
jgi:hypothetical protein